MRNKENTPVVRSNMCAVHKREPGVIKTRRACSLLSKAHEIRRMNAAVFNFLAGEGGDLLKSHSESNRAGVSASFVVRSRQTAPISFSNNTQVRRQRFKVPSHCAGGADAETLRNPRVGSTGWNGL